MSNTDRANAYNENLRRLLHERLDRWIDRVMEASPSVDDGDVHTLRIEGYRACFDTDGNEPLYGYAVDTTERESF